MFSLLIVRVQDVQIQQMSPTDETWLLKTLTCHKADL